MAFVTPDPPTAAEEAALRGQLPAFHIAAAKAIARADILLIVTGAGFSAASGLSTYDTVRDEMAASGRDLSYNDLCNADLLRGGVASTTTSPPSDAVPERRLHKRARKADPTGIPDDEASRVALFYGFWGACYNAYRDATPHAGYSIIARWRAQLLDPDAHFFSLTTNVDGHWLRFVPEHVVEQFNGSSLRVRCVDRQCTLRLARARDPACPGGMWAVPDDWRARVDAERHVAPGGATLPLVAPRGGTGVGSAQPHDSAAFARNHPVCVSCGGRARPAVKMFNEYHTYVELPQRTQEEWRLGAEVVAKEMKQGKVKGRRSGGGPCRVVVLEIGCGVTVKTMRHASMKSAQCFAGESDADVTVIRVNPAFPMQRTRPGAQPGTGISATAVSGGTGPFTDSTSITCACHLKNEFLLTI